MAETTSSPARFKVTRARDASGVSGTGHILDGIVWHNGWVSVCWRTDTPGHHGFSSIGTYPSWAAFYHIHIGAHPENGTRVEWLDPPAWCPSLPPETLEEIKAAKRIGAAVVATLAAETFDAGDPHPPHEGECNPSIVNLRDPKWQDPSPANAPEVEDSASVIARGWTCTRCEKPIDPEKAWVFDVTTGQDRRQHPTGAPGCRKAPAVATS